MDKILYDLTKEIEKYSIQFFNNGNPGNPELKPISLGSGVLLKHDSNHYIATAAHVVDNSDVFHIGVYTREKNFFEIGTTCKCKEANDETKSTLDIAIWYIEPEIVEEIAPLDWWYDVNWCLKNHTESNISKYYIYGFPAKKIKINEKTKAIEQYPFKYFTRGYSCSPNAKNVNYNPKFNLLLEFHKNKIIDIRTNKRQTAPDPYGISGCGLWYLDGLKYRLVGLMTEWKTPTDKIPALMATKIDYVLAAIDFFERNLLKKTEPPL